MDKPKLPWTKVELNGLTWFVRRDGQVKAPAHTTAYTRSVSGHSVTYYQTRKERIVASNTIESGYRSLSVLVKGKRVRVHLHRLVAIAFVPGYQDGLCVNHKDGNKLNNDPSNLEWVSFARNTQHAWEIGLVDLRGENNPAAKLTSKRVVYIRRLLQKGISAHTIAIVAGLSPASIYLIRDGKRWKD